ncbi:MAG: ABC transporter permease [Acidobacteriota bacterium]|nr:ABC transporter permease [Acidobacteriota bacterium]
MDSLWMDLRFALRSLRKNLFVTLFIAGSLALAIAGNTVTFSLINGVLYRPLPYEEPERLYLLGEHAVERPELGVSPASALNFLDWRERQSSFTELAGFQPGSAGWTGDDGVPEAVSVVSVSPELFPLVGVAPGLGRFFEAREVTEGREKLLVASYRFWEQRLGADPEAVGTELRLDGELFQLVGVLPEGFEVLDPTVQLWRPMVLDRSELDRSQRTMLVLGRLAPGVEREQARQEMEAITAALAEEHPDANRGYAVSLTNLRHDIPDDTDRQLFALLQGALLAVLLIACANIANLLLARSQRRERELALRTSLGAGRGRIARQLLTESLVLAALGGLAGLALSYLGVSVIAKAMAPRLPSFMVPVVDGRVLLFTLAVTALAGLLCGLAPILQTRRLNLVSALKEGGRGSGSRRRLMANGLVVAEIALALVLLGGASVLVRSMLDLQNRDPGFASDNLLVFNLRLPEAAYPDDEAVVRGVETLDERLTAIPGVASVTTSDQPARTPFMSEDTLKIDGEELGEGQAQPRATWMVADGGFDTTVGLELLEGRWLQATDRADTPSVVVINRSLADRHWPAGDAVGRRLTLLGRSREVVGVVASVRHGFFLDEGEQPTLYVPLGQESRRNIYFTLRTDVPPYSAAESVRTAVAEVDSRLAVAQLQSLDDYVAQFFVGARIFTSLLGGFGVLALFLAALGTYGVLAYSVAQRRHELGVRMAIGARRGQVVGLVTRQGLKLAVLGLILGVPGVIGVTRLIGSTMAGFVGIRPMTVVAVGLVLLAVTVLASLLPARRAASVDPLEALRAE